MSSNRPAKLLGKLLDIEKSRSEHGGGQDVRRFPRVEARGEAELQPIDHNRKSSERIEAQLRDIAWGGIGFICQRELEVDTHWILQLLDGGQQVGHQPILVRHCQRVDGGLYLVGAQICIDNGFVSLLRVDRRKLGS